MYNKLFTKILDSSIWLENNPTRIVWVTLIAAMDEQGYCAFAAPANVARRAGVTLLEAQRALSKFEGPDPDSSDPEHEGRRVERVPGGWVVLNAAKYRDLVTRAVIQDQTRARVRKHRENKASNALVTLSNGSNGIPQNSNASVTQSEADTDTRSRSAADGKEGAPLSDVTPKRKGDGRPLALGLRRLKVWRWMLEDLIETLGSHAEAFDIEAWLQVLDQRETGVIVRMWPWLKDELLAEVTRRGLPVAAAGKLSAEEEAAAGLALVKRRDAGDWT